MSEQDEKLSDAETQRRLDAALKHSLKMKPKPHKPKKDKPKKPKVKQT